MRIKLNKQIRKEAYSNRLRGIAKQQYNRRHEAERTQKENVDKHVTLYRSVVDSEGSVTEIRTSTGCIGIEKEEKVKNKRKKQNKKKQ